MKLNIYAPDPLNEQASVLVDAQTDIKTAIKQGVLSGSSFLIVKKSVREIIIRALTRIRSPTLREDARISLFRFANKLYLQFKNELTGIAPNVIPAVVLVMQSITTKEKSGKNFIPKNDLERNALQSIAKFEGLHFNAYAKGIPLREFQKNYMDRVTLALDTVAKENALDPNDFTGKNSLRNLAEMQVRYERHQEEISGFKEKGIKLVVCSVHADCSDRCAPYQGRVYSLDGTRGETEDGREFVPLEDATDNPDDAYTTKAGRTYQNGLLGFNCRHKLFEYRPRMSIPTVSENEQKYEYEITITQRKLERSVIQARENALVKKGVDIKEYKRWKFESERRFSIYKAFCKEHGRAYYPDRVKIL